MIGALLSALLVGALTAPVQESQDEEKEPVVLGKSSASRFGQPAEFERIDLARGSRLRLAPEVTSPLLELVHSPIRVEVIDRHDGWARVRYEAWKGWVLTDGRDTGPLLGGAVDPRGVAGVRLERALALMGDGGRRAKLGPYDLVTDVRGDRLIRHLEGVVERLASGYHERFGVDPGPPRGEVVVIFADEADYRAFEENEMQLAGLETLGHTVEAVIAYGDERAELLLSTLSVTFVGDRRPAAVREVLVHELTHLLNRRALGPDVPPWLEEGMAEDLAFSRIDADGRIEPGSWGGSSDQRGYLAGGGGARFVAGTSGSLAALARLISIWQKPLRPELELLTRLPWRVLADTETRRTLYAESAILLRYLLDASGDETAARVRSFLAAFARGDAAAEAIWTEIGVAPEELEEPVYLWMRRQANALGILFAD